MKDRFALFDALILDFDGVVVESNDIKARAFAELFGDHPEHLGAILGYHRQNLGISRYKKFAWIYRELLQRPLPQRELESLGSRFSERVVEKIVAAPFVAGARETLSACRRTGLPVFVISGTPIEELGRIVARRGLTAYFTRIWGSPIEKWRAIGEITASYGFAPSQMLFVGDGRSDHEAATRTGVPFVARKSDGEAVDWRRLGVPCVADLEPLACAVLNRATSRVP